MSNAFLGSLVLTWLSFALPATTTHLDDTPAKQAERIVTAWPSEPIPAVESIQELVLQCGQPTLLVIPPRPGDPVQKAVVSHLSDQLAPLSFRVEDGERIQSAVERDADRTYAETSDATAATRILFARQGDYKLEWRIEVDINGPRDLYGVETWQATARLQASIVNLVMNRELPAVDIETQARQRTREAALDESIATAISQLGDVASGPLLQNWYAASIGQNIVIVNATGSRKGLELLAERLAGVAGVRGVERASPHDPPRLLVTGSLTAQDLAEALGSGQVDDCRQLTLSSTEVSWWWLLLPGGIVLGVLILGMIFRTANQNLPPDGTTALEG